MAKRRRIAKRSAPKAPKEIVFDYIKSNLFRVIPIDGAFGGLSPNGREIRMALFNERRPIPQKTVHPLGTDGNIVGENRGKRTGRTGFVREVEVDVVLDFQTAINLQVWLQDKIEQMAKAHGERTIEAIKASEGKRLMYRVPIGN
jgi:hypothetical protein